VFLPARSSQQKCEAGRGCDDATAPSALRGDHSSNEME
jgi:hypothetical protein